MSRNSAQNSSTVATVHDHEKSVQLSLRLNRWILKPIGAWPKSADLSWIEKFMYFLVNVICISLIGFLFVPCTVHMVFEVDDAYTILKILGHLAFCLMAFVKYVSMIWRENDIHMGIKQIEDDWTTTRHYSDRAIMIDNAKFGRRFVMISATFHYGNAVFYYLVLPIMNKITEDNGNLTYRPLVFPVARMIVDVRYSPANEIFFWGQLMSGLVAHAVTAGACSLAAMLAMHAYGRLKVLAHWIEHLVDGRDDFCVSIDKRLIMIVQQHIRILRFISHTDRILREIAFVEIAGCTLNICLLGYYALTVRISCNKYVSQNVSLVFRVKLEIVAVQLQNIQQYA
ncbi:PREDICTED: uncharacterized protein LOC105448048 [Wasmannia auropunctata]|uniref:uncharacterized protein LOC105448048 n=1 Tax=Wasmannia auropunctata TaxID=64793 RepID=UPI0005EF32D7|nr:PREDICTED: uncharacterized protein LOC105448048 [Wasmannia auropunctata]